jgi:general nucleoside transport system ATP-binding protein
MVLRTANISRRFGAITACRDVSLAVEAGEVMALLGENGAGKSTLLSIIAGFVTPDAGTVDVAGEPLPPGNPAAAIRAGIGTAFQHFSLSPALDVRENLALARIEPSSALSQLPGQIDPAAPVRELTVPERQQVELLKARMLARRILLLDEPTSLLGDEDVTRVLGQIREVASEGTAVVFVTHRLHEALAVASRIVVMRRGQIVDWIDRPAEGWPREAEAELLAAMFGDVAAATEVSDELAPPSSVGAEIVVSGRLGGDPLDISLQAGRWLAVAGIAGNGQRDLVDLITGTTAERVVVTEPGGMPVPLTGRSMQDWLARNLAIVPEDRFHEGGAVEMSVGENLVLRDLVAGRLVRGGLVSLRDVRKRAGELIRRWDIRPPDATVPFGTLSGGNAQRVVLARSLDPPPTVLLAVRPTHGLDHHSVAMVRAALHEATGAGAAVVTIEQELDEALRYADAVAVMHRGSLSAPVPAGTADRAALQAMMVRGWMA